MVTDGVDRYSGGRFDPEDPYVQAAISDAQKAGVIVYSIYYRGAGRFDRNWLVTDGGQNYLTQVSDSTGGKVYLEGFGNPVSFAPFLSDIQRKLQNQYELTFVSYSETRAAGDPGENQPTQHQPGVSVASSRWACASAPVKGLIHPENGPAGSTWAAHKIKQGKSVRRGKRCPE